MTKEEFLSAASEKYDQWKKSQTDQTSGYEYEKSFDQMMVELGQLLLQGSVGDLPKDKKKKEKSRPGLDK
jgi:hypothetical protein